MVPPVTTMLQRRRVKIRNITMMIMMIPSLLLILLLLLLLVVLVVVVIEDQALPMVHRWLLLVCVSDTISLRLLSLLLSVPHTHSRISSIKTCFPSPYLSLFPTPLYLPSFTPPSYNRLWSKRYVLFTCIRNETETTC